MKLILILLLIPIAGLCSLDFVSEKFDLRTCFMSNKLVSTETIEDIDKLNKIKGLINSSCRSNQKVEEVKYGDIDDSIYLGLYNAGQSCDNYPIYFNLDTYCKDNRKCHNEYFNNQIKAQDLKCNNLDNIKDKVTLGQNRLLKMMKQLFLYTETISKKNNCSNMDQIVTEIYLLLNELNIKTNQLSINFNDNVDNISDLIELFKDQANSNLVKLKKFYKSLQTIDNLSKLNALACRSLSTQNKMFACDKSQITKKVNAINKYRTCDKAYENLNAVNEIRSLSKKYKNRNSDEIKLLLALDILSGLDKKEMKKGKKDFKKLKKSYFDKKYSEAMFLTQYLNKSQKNRYKALAKGLDDFNKLLVKYDPAIGTAALDVKNRKVLSLTKKIYKSGHTFELLTDQSISGLNNYQMSQRILKYNLSEVIEFYGERVLDKNNKSFDYNFSPLIKYCHLAKTSGSINGNHNLIQISSNEIASYYKYCGNFSCLYKDTKSCSNPRYFKDVKIFDKSCKMQNLRTNICENTYYIVDKLKIARREYKKKGSICSGEFSLNRNINTESDDISINLSALGEYTINLRNICSEAKIKKNAMPKYMKRRGSGINLSL